MKEGEKLFFQQIINGLAIGSSYALVAIGYTMVFGVIELTNLAHSAVFMLGAYIACAMMAGMFGFPMAVVVTLASCGFAGILIDRVALNPMRKRGASGVSYLICTIGVSFFIQNAIMLFFGSEAKPFPKIIENVQFPLGDSCQISTLQIITIVAALVLAGVTTLIVNYTKVGAAMRAIAQNPSAAKLMGINVNTIITVTFFIASFLAAVAGILIAMYYRSIDLTLGFTVGMKTFASAVLGGIGVLPGAMVGGFLIGVLESLFGAYVSNGFKDAVAFIILIIVLLVRPTGLMGKKSIKKV